METSYFNLIVTIGLTGEQDEMMRDDLLTYLLTYVRWQIIPDTGTETAKQQCSNSKTIRCMRPYACMPDEF